MSLRKRDALPTRGSSCAAWRSACSTTERTRHVPESCKPLPHRVDSHAGAAVGINQHILHFDRAVLQSAFQCLRVDNYPPQREQRTDSRFAVMNGAETVLQERANCILSARDHVNDRNFGCAADVGFGIFVDNCFHRHLEFMCNIENVSRVEQNRSDTCSTCRISGIWTEIHYPGPSTAARFLLCGPLPLIFEYPFSVPPFGFVCWFEQLLTIPPRSI